MDRHPLESVPFFQRPMSATTRDVQVGEDDMGNGVFVTPTGQRYTIRLNPDQRTTRQKIKEGIPKVKKSIEDYLNDPRIPSKQEAIIVGKALAKSYKNFLEDMVSGRATMGDVFGTVAGMGGSSTLFKVPQDSTRIFGGMRMKGGESSSAFKEAVRMYEDLPEEVYEEPELFLEAVKKIKDKTGWYINPRDNKPRFELSDKDSKVKQKLANIFNNNTKILEKNSREFNLSDIFDHSILYSRYPQFKNLKVKVYSDKESERLASFVRDHYDKNGSHMILNVNQHADIEDLRNSLLHEIQHAVQYEEYFPLGSNYQAKLKDSAEKDLEKEKERLEKEIDERSIKYLETDADDIASLSKPSQDMLASFIAEIQSKGLNVGKDLTKIDDLLDKYIFDYKVTDGSKEKEYLKFIAETARLGSKNNNIDVDKKDKFYRGSLVVVVVHTFGPLEWCTG